MEDDSIVFSGKSTGSRRWAGTTAPRTLNRGQKLLMSIPGVGPVVAVTVLGEAGDLRRFKNWKHLRKLCGYNLVEQSSGQKKGQSVISKRGRPGLRHILYLAALAA